MNTESDSDISVHLRVSTAKPEHAEIRHVNHDLQMEDHGPSLDNLLIERVTQRKLSQFSSTELEYLARIL